MGSEITDKPTVCSATYLDAFVGRISAHLHELGNCSPRISTQSETAVLRIFMNLEAVHSIAFPRNNKHGPCIPTKWCVQIIVYIMA